MMKKINKKIKTVCIVLFVLGCIIALNVKIIFVKEMTGFDANYDINKSNFCSFTKESFIVWSEDENIRKKFDIRGTEEKLKDLEDDQRLMVSLGNEISFFYRIGSFGPIKVKYKNDKVTNKVYVYKMNYDDTITGYKIY